MIDRLRRILQNPGTVTERALNASAWNVAGLALRYPIRLAGNLIMVRLLAPEAFGLMATVAAIHTGLTLFSEVGIMQSVMRSEKGEEPRFLRTVWVVQILRGLIISAVLLAITAGVWVWGPVLAGPRTVYADPLLPGLLLISVIAVLAKGLQSTSVLLARRRMALKPVLMIEVWGQVAGFVTMVGLGFLIQNVWALVIGMVMREIVSLILSFRIVPGPAMRWVWDPAEMGALWRFGRWLIIASIGGFFATHGDRLLLGGLIDKTTFGVYVIAMVWIEIGVQLLQRIGMSVFIPSFGEIIAKTPERIDQALRRSFWAFAGLTLVVFTGLYLLGGWVIDLLYPDQYAMAQLFVELLAFRLILLMFIPHRQYLIGIGASRYVGLTQAVAGVSAALAVIYGFEAGGMEIAALAFAISGLPAILILLAHRELRGRIGPWPVVMALAFPGFVWVMTGVSG